MFINVEFGPMAAPHYESGKPPEIGVLTSRILERAFSDSRCVDLESLCIVSEEKVWQLRVDVSVLNDAGNVCDCASLGVLAALHHFRRPDVTSHGDSITIHTERERDAIPLVLHHFPVCVSFAIFESLDHAVADPTAVEERVAQSSVVYGINSYQELCGLHLGGSFLTSPELMIKTATIAAKQAKQFVDMIRAAVEKDTADREAGKRVSFMQCIVEDAIKTTEQDRVFVKLRKIRKVEQRQEKQEEDAMEIAEDVSIEAEDLAKVAQEEEIVQINTQSAVLTSNKWIPENDDSDADEVPSADKGPIKEKGKVGKAQKKAQHSDSEEEETMVLN